MRTITLPDGAIDRTPPNYGLTRVFTNDRGAAFWCLACGAGTGAGAYTLENTRTSARMHLAGQCPHPEAHHITKTVMATQVFDTPIMGRRRRPTMERVSYPVASCTCGWKAAGEDNDRASGQRLARAHREAAHERWLAS